MKRLSVFIALAVLAAAVPAFAETPADKKEMTFEQRKELALSRLDKHISTLQELRKCISDAKTKEEMGKCRETFKEEREGMKQHKK